MDNFLTVLVNQIRVLWAGLSGAQKAATVAATVLAVIAFTVLVIWAQRPDYTLLYSRLEPEDAGNIVQKIEEAGVPYQLTRNGTAIMVPSQDMYEMRLRLAREGLPEQGGIGYEIFDKTSLGMSDFLQKVSRQRALEGELTRTIQAMEGIQQARVHLVMPEPTLFEEEEREATASVLLRLRQPGALNQRQVRGVASLMARSVEGLKPENVTIVDFSGNVLSDNLSNDPLAALSSSQMEIQRDVESRLEKDVRNLLEGALGRGKVLVRASVELNFEKIEKTLEKYDPENTVIRSEERSKEQGDSPSSKRESTVTNYEINRTVERFENAMGGIEKLSVGVIVDGTYETVTNDEGVEERRYMPRSDEEIGKFTSIVKSAVGYDAERGDQVEVVSMPFETGNISQVKEDMMKQERREFWMTVAERVIPWVLLLGVLVMLYLHLKKLAAKVASGKLLPAAPPAMGQPGGAGSDQSLSGGVLGPNADPNLQGQIALLARQNPAATSDLLRTWLQEQEASDGAYTTSDA